MRKAIIRNIAIVSAVFTVSFSVMLITNYLQVRGATPLQTEVIGTLKEINDANADNAVLQEQIRQLDLLARRAYFVRMDNLVNGVYILLGMLIVFLVCARLYFAKDKDVPDKEIAPVDEWAEKTQARRYIVWGTVGIAAVAMAFVFLSSPHYRQASPPEKTADQAIAVENTDNSGETDATEGSAELQPDSLPKPATQEPDLLATDSAPTTPVAAATETAPDTTQKAASEAVSKVTHNAFRGNNGNGRSSAKGVPSKWDLSKGANIAWKQPVPRKGYNSPVINGGRVFFTGADAEARELYCYDLLTGERRWSLAASDIAGSPSAMPKTNDDTGLAASSVATNGKQVCAIFATGDIICADMDGKRLWAKNLGAPDNHYGYASSLVTFRNTVIVQYDNRTAPRVIAFDLATGAERWNKTRQEKITWSSPSIAYVNNNAQLVLMGNPAITAYNPNNGEQIWRVEGMSGEVGSSACSSDGVVFGASEYAKMLAINATDGSVLWEASDYLPEVSSPVATKENVYVATSYGVLAVYDAQTGALRKAHELNTEFYSSPVIAEGRIYLLSNAGTMYLFSADSECRLLDSFDTGEKTFATPAFTDGKIVVRTENSIYCVASK